MLCPFSALGGSRVCMFHECQNLFAFLKNTNLNAESLGNDFD